MLEFLSKPVLGSKEEALLIMQKALHLLSDGGYVILTFLSSSWLLAKDFEEL
jgi:hypothetical protein